MPFVFVVTNTCPSAICGINDGTNDYLRVGFALFDAGYQCTSIDEQEQGDKNGMFLVVETPVNLTVNELYAFVYVNYCLEVLIIDMYLGFNTVSITKS